MNRKAKIIIDSTCDINESISGRFTVVPLTVHFGDESYTDKVNLSHRQFYEKLIESDVVPTTSQASPAAFHEKYEKIVNEGFDAVVLTISSKLSGTYQSATIAAEEYEGRVFVVDNGSTTIGAGILAEMAADMAESDMTAEEIAAALEREKKNIIVVAMLDTLEYLKRGGRISKTAAFAGGLLSIKPVICLDDGEIKVLGKARGSKQGNNFLVKEIQKAGGVDFDKPVLLGFAGLNDDLLQKYIEDSRYMWEQSRKELSITSVGSVVGTHVGPGAVAVAFFKKNK